MHCSQQLFLSLRRRVVAQKSFPNTQGQHGNSQTLAKDHRFFRQMLFLKDGSNMSQQKAHAQPQEVLVVLHVMQNRNARPQAQQNRQIDNDALAQEAVERPLRVEHVLVDHDDHSPRQQETVRGQNEGLAHEVF